MPDRMRTTASTFADGDIGGLVAGKTLLDAIEIRFRLGNAGPSPLSVAAVSMGPPGAAGGVRSRVKLNVATVEFVEVAVVLLLTCTRIVFTPSRSSARSRSRDRPGTHD